MLAALDLHSCAGVESATKRIIAREAELAKMILMLPAERDAPHRPPNDEMSSQSFNCETVLREGDEHFSENQLVSTPSQKLEARIGGQGDGQTLTVSQDSEDTARLESFNTKEARRHVDT